MHDNLIRETEEQEWQPIGTAPEAETVLVWLPNYGHVSAHRTGGVWFARGGGGEVVFPSHWRPELQGPLPAVAASVGAGSVPADFSLLGEVAAIERKQQVADQLEAAYQRGPHGMPVEIPETIVLDILAYLRSYP